MSLHRSSGDANHSIESIILGLLHPSACAIACERSRFSYASRSFLLPATSEAEYARKSSAEPRIFSANMSRVDRRGTRRGGLECPDAFAASSTARLPTKERRWSVAVLSLTEIIF